MKIYENELYSIEKGSNTYIVKACTGKPAYFDSLLSAVRFVSNTNPSLPREALLSGIRDLLAVEWINEYENSGCHIPPGSSINEYADEGDDYRLIPIAEYYCRLLDAHWPITARQTFTLLGVPEDLWGDAFYYTMMGCVGHGVNLIDFMDTNKFDAEAYEEFTDVVLDPSPFYHEMNELNDYSQELIQTRLQGIVDENDAKDGKFPYCAKLYLESRLPSGDTLDGDVNYLADYDETSGVVRFVKDHPTRANELFMADFADLTDETD